ncbi:MAG: hypothetical protein CVV28_10485 [Methanobacteriales archaeon HGW-Methanobacteriales-1]|jgi:glycosyltransferase involved in cell wall biosynthesis|nr:MAG: hypothetical protein CVV28_10485 [Methanobacteriales archaeon HGW-Methanobacteriales-1]
MKKKILCVSPGPNIIDPKTGTDNRMHHLVSQLSKINDVIALIPEQHINRNISVPFEVHGFKLGSSPYLTDFNVSFLKNLFNLIRKENFDIIHIAFPQGILTSKFMCNLLGSNTIIVYDSHKVEGDAAKEFSNPNLPLIKRMAEPYFIPLLERIAIKLTNHVLAVSDVDKNRFIQKYSLNPEEVSVVPSGIDLEQISKSKNNDYKKNDSEIRIIFHGLYSYFPNKEAIDIIIDCISPKIYKMHENAIFLIAGKDVPIFENKNVRSLGFVDSIYSLLKSSDIAIAPLLNGGGTKLKILDYMGAGLPIVTTPKGIEGIEIIEGNDAIIVNNVDKEFINAIIFLIENYDERKRIGINATKIAKNYDWKNIGKNLDSLYNHLTTN